MNMSRLNTTCSLLHCKTRRRVYGGLIALAALSGLSALTLLPSTAGADDANPTTLDTPAPELVGATWANTPNNAPLTLASRKGKVTIVQFWTYGCINCRHNLPAYSKWQKQFGAKDVAIIGVHTPETRGEADEASVRAHIRDYGITYPVLIDSKSVNWKRWSQQYWPTVYLLDRKGNVRYRWEGELEYNGQDGTRKLSRIVDGLLGEK